MASTSLAPEISLKKSLPILAIEKLGQAAATAASAIPV